jgi:hypothetical protein
MRNSAHLALALLFACASESTMADGVYVANVRYEKLVPRWPDSCNQRMGAPDKPVPRRSDGQQEICISNACGWSEVSLRPVQTLIGSKRSRAFVYRSEVGEWCKPRVFPAQNPVLVDEQDGRMEFFRLYRTDKNQLALAPVPYSQIHGVQLSKLTPTDSPAPFTEVFYAASTRMTPEELEAARRNPSLTERGDGFYFAKLVTLQALRSAIAAP